MQKKVASSTSARKKGGGGVLKKKIQGFPIIANSCDVVAGFILDGVSGSCDKPHLSFFFTRACLLLKSTLLFAACCRLFSLFLVVLVLDSYYLSLCSFTPLSVLVCCPDPSKLVMFRLGSAQILRLRPGF